MKKLFWLTTILVLCFSVIASDECTKNILISNIPCQIISAWDYPNSCNNYSIIYYNNLGQQVGNDILSDYGISPFCNVSFNFTNRMTYSYNISSGDTGTITVEDDEMQNLVNLGLYGFFMVASFVLAWFMHNNKEESGSSVAYGFFAATLQLIMGSMLLVGFNIFGTATFSFPFNVNKMLGVVCYIFAIFCMWYSTSILRSRNMIKRQQLDEAEYRPQ